uniref:ATP synthase subunit a n=1 Tax=Columbicola macrourae TaxID=128993 RepID=A0A6G7SK15_9NEOP|nr:ATP synthase F0 subunit 6 [Columbicola macrourae]
MMHSLMSVFDPEAHSLPMKWTQCIVVFVLVKGCFFTAGGGTFSFVKGKLLGLVKLLSQGMSAPKTSLIFTVCLFLFLFFVNESGLLPFVFTSSSHLVFNFSFSIPLWMGGLFLLSMKSFLSHLVPHGSPLGLSPFLVFIELISLGVRPISLGVRLMSNIMAGHMVLCLIQSMAGDSLLAGGASVFLSSLFLTFELAVSLVQAFVFVNLLYMYIKESE